MLLSQVCRFLGCGDAWLHQPGPASPLPKRNGTAGWPRSSWWKGLRFFRLKIRPSVLAKVLQWLFYLFYTCSSFLSTYMTYLMNVFNYTFPARDCWMETENSFSRAAGFLVFIQYPVTAFSHQRCHVRYTTCVTFTIPLIAGEGNLITPYRLHTRASSWHRISKKHRGEPLINVTRGNTFD